MKLFLINCLMTGHISIFIELPCQLFFLFYRIWFVKVLRKMRTWRIVPFPHYFLLSLLLAGQ